MAKSSNNSGIQFDAELLRNSRTKLGLSQEALAEQAKLTRRTIQRAENGEKIGLRTAHSIAKALNLEVEYLTVSIVEEIDTTESDDVVMINSNEETIDQAPNDNKNTTSPILTIIGFLYAIAVLVSAWPLNEQTKQNSRNRDNDLARCERVYPNNGGAEVIAQQSLCTCKAFSRFRAERVRITHYLIPFSYKPQKPNYETCS